MSKTAICLTGKTGDLLNILPLAELISKEKGYPIGFVTCKPYAHILQGVSYVTPVIFDGPFIEVGMAMRRGMEEGYDDLLVAQIYGKGISKNVQQTDSFCKDAWRVIGHLKDYGLPLNIDRPPEPSIALKALLPKDDKPIILVSVEGQSAPFKQKARLLDLLTKHFRFTAHIINLANYNRFPLLELLYLYDRASVLVSVDTSHLHLANARPSLPVCALAANEPGLWYSTPKRTNHTFYCRYNDFHDNERALVATVAGAILPKPVVIAPSEPVPDKPRIFHVWSARDNPDAETRRRQLVAQRSWKREADSYHNWTDLPIPDHELKRNATLIGDTAPLPFIHDLIERGMLMAGDNDIVLLTNSDIGLVRGFADEVAYECRVHGAIFSHRWDFSRMANPLDTKEQVQQGKWYVGTDAVAFTKAWWLAHKHDLPDFVLGREAWDWVMRELVHETGGQEIHAACFHETHDAPWKRHEIRNWNQGNQYNRGYARKWLGIRQKHLKEIANAPFRSVIWPVEKKIEGAPEARAVPSGPRTDVVVVLGKGSKWSDTELRFCLRGMERYAGGLGNIYVVGRNPGFLNPAHITHLAHEDPNHNKEHNITNALERACRLPHLSEEFVFFNDDHFLIDHIELATYPYYEKGTLAEGVESATAGGYRKSMANTLKAMTEGGHPLISYEVHMPIRYNKHKFLELSPWWERSAQESQGLLPRSIYANVVGVKGEHIRDCKLRKLANEEDLRKHIVGRHVFSIHDEAISFGVADYLFKKFPVRSRFELSSGF